MLSDKILTRLSSGKDHLDSEISTGTITVDPKLKKPPLYRVILLNDDYTCLLYTSPSPRDISGSRMPSSA